MSVKATVEDIGKFLEKGRPMKDRIYRVGVELEGGWTHLPQGAQPERDGSIQLPNSVPDPTHKPEKMIKQLDGTMKLESQRKLPVVVGEIVSDPLEVGKVPAWIRAYYPQVVNHTCGLHAHVSFRDPLNYQRLMTKEFPEATFVYLTKWAKDKKFSSKHPIWSRLSGQNRYCTKEFFPDLQVAATSKNYAHERPGNRYTAINYCHGLHSTIECRLLPMFEGPEEAIEAVKQFLTITNATLVVLARKEEKLSAEVKIDPLDAIIDERHEII